MSLWGTSSLKKMRVSEFDFELPSELIAQKPLRRRDHSRMMILDRKRKTIEHTRFFHFPDYFNDGDVLVLNESKVIPARVWGRIEEKEIEFLFLREVRPCIWEVLCRPARVVNKGKKAIFSNHLLGRVKEEEKEGKRILEFSSPDVLLELEKIGYPPLPPYIKRQKRQQKLKEMDLRRYQTVYAKEKGSIAAPTAGMHFTKNILDDLKKKGVNVVNIILHVGLATFQPVREEKVEGHFMPEETYSLDDKAAALLNQTKEESRLITAVGTTSVRALESAWQSGKINPRSEATDLFIYPGYEFKAVDRLLTNFHLPRSTLLMLVSAFAGKDFIFEAYQEAVKLKYRFFSYGDCMLIL